MTAGIRYVLWLCVYLSISNVEKLFQVLDRVIQLYQKLVVIQELSKIE